MWRIASKLPVQKFLYDAKSVPVFDTKLKVVSDIRYKKICKAISPL